MEGMGNDSSPSLGQYEALSNLCGRRFWDPRQAWDTEDPVLGVCVERTVLVWVPCFLLWVFSPLYLVVLRNTTQRSIPWTTLGVVKVVLSSVTISAAVAEVVWALVVRGSGHSLAFNDFLAPLILLISYVLQLCLLLVGRRYGDHSSGLLWCFWFLTLLCGLPQLKSVVSSLAGAQEDEYGTTLITTFITRYVAALLLFSANCIADNPPRAAHQSKNDYPEERSSFVSRLTYHFATGLVWRGWRHTLQHEELWNLPARCKTSNLDLVWTRAWRKELARGRHQQVPSSEQNGTVGKSSPPIRETTGNAKVSVVRVMLRAYFWPYLFATIVYVISELMLFLTPQLLSLLISFTTDESQPLWRGYFYAGLLLLVSLTTTVVKNIFYYRDQIIAAQLRASFMGAVYRKALVLSATARRQFTLGEIVNLMAVDSQRLSDIILYFNLAWGAPIVITMALYYLWQILGPSVLAGLAVLVLLIPVNSVIANQVQKLQVAQMKFKDKRIKMVSEIINGIKVLKLYAWEASFVRQVQEIRRDEIRVMRKSAYFQAFISFIFLTSPYMVALASFATYLLTSSENKLDAQTAFVSLSLFNIMRMPITQLPGLIAQFIQARVSLRRMERFLSSDVIDSSAVSRDDKEKSAVVVSGGEFTWGVKEDEEPWVLRDVDLRVEPGQLVAVVGSVGAGKSSLVSALLGEMTKNAGRVTVNGKVAYVAQQAWLQNASLKDNITWGQPVDEKKYQKVISACALQPDLDMLPAGDMTEIGEKGVNMSGGQKQRIALARAAYSDADIFLLDDPLSAVDAHVGRHIFDSLIGPQGLMNGKTRILVTHALAYLPRVDSVVVMQDGRLVERGTYSQLLAKGGNFAQFLLNHINNAEEVEDDEDDIDELVDQLEDTPMGQKFLSQLARQNSKVEEGSAHGRIGSIRRRRRGSSCGSGTRLSESDTEGRGVSRILRQDSKLRPSVDHEKIPMKDMKEPAGKTLVQEETSETGKVKWKVYQFYAATMGLLPAILPCIFFAVAQGCQAGGNIWLSQWSTKTLEDDEITDNVTDIMSNATSNTTEDGFNKTQFLAGYGGFGLGQSLFYYMGSFLIWTGCMRAGIRIHHRVLDNVLRLPMSFFDTNPSGRIMNRFSKDVDVLDSLLPMLMGAGLSCFAQVATTLIVLVGSTPLAGLVIVPIMVFYYFIQVVYISSARQLRRIESVSKSPIFSHFGESVQGVATLRAFKMEDAFMAESQRRVDLTTKANISNLACNRWLGVRLEFIGNLITFVAAIFSVVGRGDVSAGMVGLAITYALNVTVTLNWLVRVSSDIEANIVSVERIMEYIQEEREAEWTIQKTAPPHAWPEHGVVSFNKYQTRYRPGLDLVLKDVSCTIQAGEKVGIVGRTGAGKSSLTLALFRIIEAAGGDIVIDGVDISNIGLHDLRNRLSIIPQDPVLFSGTLRLNLDPFNEHSEKEVWRAVEMSHLGAFVKAQTETLQYAIDEGGSNLSVGQRQLVSLARALLRQSRILVLDEATAAVDVETDDLIQKTIRSQFANCTILTIAHRLNTIMDSDRVMVLDKGKIAEFSDPASLLADKKSIFYGMAKDAGLV
ncbi:canalicular multispecific organic anion transporter 2-like [Penaeus monodon]|uniref:canalicular multispecific organic anion transporter 2-like n=1 Tax=Penaeus monodon TaxID=6687 RepID=UPI0018A7DC8F|nr:canalicular multispecific organic anion transporter 2-like [Penaeus monodon]